MTHLAKHPVLLGLAIIVAVGLIGTWPLLLIPAVMAPALWYITTRYDRHHQAQLTRTRGLEARADYEHHALTHGDPRGVHGRYPPAAA